ncbi:MAG TPA: hypothetical protein VFO95_14195 [Gemmatimonadales bacterium]|nr:hypothetical protein [Gemmatimonadales bacterium]
MERHVGLAAGYGSAMLGWFMLSRLVPMLWPYRDAPHFANPGKELSYAVLGMAGTLLLGFLYVRGMLLPASADSHPVVDVVNQLIVFVPILLVPLFRRHPLGTLWLPADRVSIRIATGVLLALAALTAYRFTASDAPPWIEIMRSVYHHRNLPFLMQVLLEDVAAAILAVRIAGVLGPVAAPLLAGVILAAGHLATSVQTGVTEGILQLALLDVVLAMAVVAVVQRSADVWWFWGVHFAMDMTQHATLGTTTS